MRSWPWGALLPVVVRARFASMCIASEALSAKESEVLARRCALQVCSLMLTTAPAEPPLVMVHGLSERQVKLVERAGAETRASPGLRAWNATGVVWRDRPARLEALSEPARKYTYHKLHMWDPAFVREPHVSFVDSDAVFVRNASALDARDLERPAAWFMRDSCKPPNVAWDLWDAGIYIDGAKVAKQDAYWNTGVVSYEPDAAVAAELWRMYGAGDFAALDPGAYVCEGDVLQTYYWRASAGALPRKLKAGWNFRGYKCSYADLEKRADLKIVHKEEARSAKMILETCEGVPARQRSDEPPAFLLALRGALDEGRCLDPRAAAELRATCPDA